MSLPIVPAVVIGGVAYVAVTGAADAAPGVVRPPAPLPGQTVGQAVGRNPNVQYTPVNVSRRTMAFVAAVRPSAGSIAFGDPLSNPIGPGGGAPVDPLLQKKLDEIEAAAAKVYSDMDEVARAEAVDKINKELKLEPPIEYGSDWKTITSAAAGAAGAAAGAAVCGPICGKVGALAGAYLGAEIHDLVAKNWDELESWISDKWGDVKSFASETYDDAKGAVEDAYDEVADTLSGMNPF